MKWTIAVIGTLDTKGEEFSFLKDEIEKRGCRTLIIDVGVLGHPMIEPDIPAEVVAEAGGARLSDLREQHDRGRALDTMSIGIAKVMRQLYEEGRVDAVISMGGGGGTAIGTSGMRVLPVEVPKVMVSTIAAGDTSPYVGTTNITMMPSIVDVAGLNRISRRIFAHAAGAICGMVMEKYEETYEERPLIAASMFGNTTRAVDTARQILEREDYEVLVFHATGMGGKTMEMLIEDNYFAGVLDITTTEWADELCGGVLSAGPHRLESAAKAGIPQVVVPGCIDMCNFWAEDTIPGRYKGRKFFRWNPNVTLMRTTPEENARLGHIFAEKLNKAKGPVSILIPMRGFSEVDSEGEVFWWPEANQAFVESLKASIRPDIPVILLDNNINDPEFASKSAEVLIEVLKEGKDHGNT